VVNKTIIDITGQANSSLKTGGSKIYIAIGLKGRRKRKLNNIENKTTMENKTTVELIELLRCGSKLVDKQGNILDQDKYEEVWGELRNREPFFTILNEDYDDGLPAAREAIKELQEEVRKLKRHKHDIKSGDVMIRI